MGTPQPEEYARLMFNPSTCSGPIASAPISTRFPLAGLSNVSRGLPDSASFRAKASVLLPGAAWAMNTWVAKSATKSLR